MTSAHALIDEARMAAHQTGILEAVLHDTDPTTQHYFAGYLFVRQIQRRLAEKDPRLLDPELFFIFVQGYFFLDRRVLSLAAVRTRRDYQERAAAFLRDAVRDLLDARPEWLKLAVDSICEYEKAPVNFAHLDFSRAVLQGQLASWADQSSFESLARQLDVYGRQRLKQIYETFPLDLAVARDYAMVIDSAAGLFGSLSRGMLFFKIKHIECAVLSYSRHRSGAYFTTWGVRGTPASFMEFVEDDELAALEGDLRSGKYDVAEAPADEPATPILAALVSGDIHTMQQLLYKSHQDRKLVVLQDYECYLVPNREGWRVWVRGDFVHRAESPTSQKADVSSAEDKQLLRSIGKYFYHGAYLPLIRIPDLEGWAPMIVDLRFQNGVLQSMWPLLYSGSSTSATDCARFLSQRARVVALREAEKSLLRSLCRSRKVEVGDQVREVNEINRRWRRYTGRDVISIERHSVGASATLVL